MRKCCTRSNYGYNQKPFHFHNINNDVSERNQIDLIGVKNRKMDNEKKRKTKNKIELVMLLEK